MGRYNCLTALAFGSLTAKAESVAGDLIQCGFVLCQPDQKLLSVKLMALHWLDAGIAAIAIQNARFHVVCHVRGQYLVNQPLFQTRIVYRAAHLSTFVKIARHPVSAADEHVFYASIQEIEDT